MISVTLSQVIIIIAKCQCSMEIFLWFLNLIWQLHTLKWILDSRDIKIRRTILLTLLMTAVSFGDRCDNVTSALQ